jgi:glycosyltransferase involved in cell wall biosynthesis
VNEARNVLVIGGNFSGTTSSLVRALQAKGCTVIHKPLSLRLLRFRIVYLVGMAVEALLTRGIRFRSHIRHTRVHDLAARRAIEVLVRSHPETDLVIQISSSCAAPSRNRAPGVTYTLFTDHTNLLSKKLPDYGVDLPERHVDRRWNDIEQTTFNGQDHIFVMGGHVKQSLVEDYGVQQSRVTVVGGGPNLDVDVERDRGTKNFSGKRILFVGFDAPRKGLGTLKSAFRLLREIHPRPSSTSLG